VQANAGPHPQSPEPSDETSTNLLLAFSLSFCLIEPLTAKVPIIRAEMTASVIVLLIVSIVFEGVNILVLWES